MIPGSARIPVLVDVLEDSIFCSPFRICQVYFMFFL